MNIVGVPGVEVAQWWPMLSPLIVPALESSEHNTLEAQAVYEAIAQGRMGCLAVIDDKVLIAVQTVEVAEDEDGHKFLNLVTTAGHRLDEWQDMLAEKLDRLAVELGVDEIRTRGRMGWLRQLKRNGYEPMYFVATRKVDLGASDGI